MEIKTEKISEKISVLFWTFVIFSILGMITEMIFCYITTGIIESRQGLVWGPFCPIYGVGAVVAILILENVKPNNINLFIYGAILGGVVEYSLSYMLEAIYGTRFWDYSYLKYNLNGRICFLYSIFWGILAIIVIKKINPMIKKIIKKIHEKSKYNILEKVLFTFLIIDTLCTWWAISEYKERAKNIYYGREEKNSNSIGEKIFPNEYMLKAFPNLRFITDEKDEIYIRNVIVPE